MNIGDTVESYKIIAVVNGYAMGKSVTAPNPYAVWIIDDDGEGVCCGHYFNDREEAEWDFCARAFEWFEDNVNIHFIEDGESIEKCKEPPEQKLIGGLKKIREDIAAAARLVDEMSDEVDRLRKEQHNDNINNQRL